MRAVERKKKAKKTKKTTPKAAATSEGFSTDDTAAQDASSKSESKSKSSSSALKKRPFSTTSSPSPALGTNTSSTAPAPAPPTATTGVSANPSVPAPPAPAVATATEKRKKPKTSATAAGASTWRQRQQAWSTPKQAQQDALAVQRTKEEAARARESERPESFEQVFLEVFGRNEHERARAALGASEYTPGALDASSTVATTGTLVSSSTRSSDSSASITTATASTKVPDTRTDASAASSSSTQTWGFASSSAMRLDDFEVPISSDAGTTASTSLGPDDASAFAHWKESHASHSVSDNFVKLHMRKRVKGSTGRAKKRPAYLRARFDPSSLDDGGDGANHDAFMDPLALRASAAKSASASASAVSGPSSAMNDGLDFIEECLEVLARVEAQRASGADASTTQDTAHTQQLSSDTGVSATPKDVEPPRCHHALLCTKVVVKKKNKNHGRVFFACPLGYDEGRCDFFLWEDNHTQLALQSLFATTATSTGDTNADTKIPAFVPLDLSRSLDEQDDALVTNLRLVFGHASFRAGQQWAISRVFQQKHTLLVLPTGAGKSLCYQYPALFLPGVTLVISPLISLMNDQFASLPPVLQQHAACLTSTSSSSKAQYAAFVRDLLGGALKLVFLSPERAVSQGFQQLLSQLGARVSLVCVDEAHCISEWSHHFRPSYLRLEHVFQHAQCVLAITATASSRVIDDILSQLTKCPSGSTNRSIKNGISADTNETKADMVLQMPWQRSNLALEVRRVRSNDERIEHLVRFLSTTKLAGGIIMYVHQQRQAEDMAAVLQDQLPGSAWQRKIAYYHARMDAEAKEKVRTGFLSGRVRVVIATIAFGMGIDKQNVRCVIHFHMPSSIENYLQQVGRAGRDGKRAVGLLYLLPDDVQTFRSLAFTNAFHRSQLRRLLERLMFAGDDEDATKYQDADTDTDDDDRTHCEHIVAVQRRDDATGETHVHVSLELEWLETYLDMKAATIETFLTLLALKRASLSDSSKSVSDSEAPADAAPSPLRIELQPSSMSTCVLHVLEKKLRDAAPDSTLKRIVQALNAKDTRLHGRITTETNGYLTMLVIEFHIREMAQLLFSADVAHALQLAPLAPTAATPSVGSLCERRLLQHVRKMQHDGQIQRMTLEKLAFHVDLYFGAKLVSGPQAASLKHALVDTWTQQLYAKHLELEALEVERLMRLYGALHAASLPCSSSRKTRQGATNGDDDDGEDAERLAKAQVLEDRLVAYFDHERVAPEDEQLMKTLLASLTPSAIDAIEADVRSLVQLAVFDTSANDDGDDYGASSSMRSYGRGSKSTKTKGTNAKNSTKSKKAPSASAQQGARARQQQMAKTQWTCYSVAKIFHGLASPCFPLLKWKDHASWKKYDAFAFETLVRIADKVLREAPDEQAHGVEQ